jgi:hypothetical protein
MMMISACPHTDRKHYAKNMCASCYRKSGRTQLTWACAHKTRLNYSLGMCQSCYLGNYNKRRNLKAKEKSVESVSLKEIETMNKEMGAIPEMPKEIEV